MIINPKVSVIVPIYNAERQLGKCIKSLSTQTLKELEIILINDGSTDSSGALCDEYARQDSRIKVMHTINGGVSVARQFGLCMATGEFVAFADSDDWMAPEMYERLYNVAKSKTLDFVWCGFYRCPGMRENPENLSKNVTAYDVIFALVKGEMWGACWNKLYRRSLIYKNSIQFPKELNACEDLVFNIRFLKYAERIKNIDEILYYYQYNPDSILRKPISPDAYKQSLILLKLIESELKDSPVNSVIQYRRDATACFLVYNRHYFACDIRKIIRENNLGYYTLSFRHKITVVLFLYCPPALPLFEKLLNFFSNVKRLIRNNI